MTQSQRSLRQALADEIVLKKRALTKIVFIADLGWLFPVACLTLQLPSGLVQPGRQKTNQGGIIMTTRRDFLKAGAAAAATGIVFCSCGLLQSAHAQQPTRKKLPVMVGGKRIKTIDVHAHCHFREAGALLGAEAAAVQLPPVNGAAEAFIEIDKRLAAMDSQAVDLEVLSINPFWYNRERDLAAEIVKIQNEKLAEPLFIHPQGVPELSKRLSGNGWLGNTIGNPLETTIALSHLIFEGTLDRFPGLKVIGAHGGGFLPSYADRSDHACLVGPKGCNPEMKLGKAPTEYLKQIYFDSLIFSPEAIRHLVAQVGAGQIVLGSDYPYPWQLQPVDHIFASATLSDDDKADILGRTAAKLFGFTA